MAFGGLTMKRWEYAISERNSELDELDIHKMNNWGREGWELISVVFVPNTSRLNYYWKQSC
jgi:hypothetical protein